MLNVNAKSGPIVTGTSKESHLRAGTAEAICHRRSQIGQMGTSTLDVSLVPKKQGDGPGAAQVVKESPQNSGAECYHNLEPAVLVQGRQ